MQTAQPPKFTRTSFLKPQGKTHLIRESLNGEEKIIYAFAIDAPNAKFEFDVSEYCVKNIFNAPADFAHVGGKIAFSAEDCQMWGTIIHLIKK